MLHVSDFGGYHFFKAICINNWLKYLIFNLMQHSGIAGQKIKLEIVLNKDFDYGENNKLVQFIWTKMENNLITDLTNINAK